jgi:hypothetical protein
MIEDLMLTATSSEVFSIYEEFTTVLLKIIILVFSSFLIRFSLVLLGQKWITTLTHTASIVLLPVITFSITSVISGNIALSLGMVGALSIIRFRNPVKSPFELVIWFLSITLGICAAVSILWLVLLVTTVICIFIGLAFLDHLFFKLFQKKFFTVSFLEGNELSTLEIFTSAKIRSPQTHDSFIASIEDVDNNSYTFASSSKKELLEIKDKYSDDKRIISISLKL